MGDIGKHFPDTDPRYAGISSLLLLKHVGELLEENGFVIENLDATIIAQRPKMRPYIDQMRENLADTLKIDLDRVNVKPRRKRDWDLPEPGKEFPLRQSAFSSPCWTGWRMTGCGPSFACGGCPGCPGEQES